MFKGKGNPVLEIYIWLWNWSRSSAVSPQVTEATDPAVGCHYFPPGPRLPAHPPSSVTSHWPVPNYTACTWWVWPGPEVAGWATSRGPNFGPTYLVIPGPKVSPFSVLKRHRSSLYINNTRVYIHAHRYIGINNSNASMVLSYDKQESCSMIGWDRIMWCATQPHILLMRFWCFFFICGTVNNLICSFVDHKFYFRRHTTKYIWSAVF